MNCPDCGAEVAEVLRRNGRGLAEQTAGGPWVLRTFHGESLPTALIAARVRDGGPAEIRWKLHKCSRRATVKDDLVTLASVYGKRKASPQMSVPINRLEEGVVDAGDVLTLVDQRGMQVRADVRRVEFVAVPRWDTLTKTSPARDRAYGRCLALVDRRGERARDRCGNAAPKGYGTCHVHRDQEDEL